MEKGIARRFYERYAPAIAYVAVEQSNGEQKIGSALHVGEGVFVTARHVVEGSGNLIVGITSLGVSRSRDTRPDGLANQEQRGKTPQVHPIDNKNLTITNGPYFHSDDRVDVAVFKVDSIAPSTPVIQLGAHVDARIEEDSFALSEAVIFGYPPIPMTKTPVLMGARAEINAVIDRYDSPHMHFVLSAMPRGGFSGGVAMSEDEFALGMVTQSLLTDSAAPELGYMSVIGVEPIHQCLTEHRFLPPCQEVTWLGPWTRKTLEFRRWNHDALVPNQAPESGLVEYLDDGRRLSVKVHCEHDAGALDHALSRARAELSNFETIERIRQAGEWLLEIEHSGTFSIEKTKRAMYTAAKVFWDRGFEFENPGDLQEMQKA